MKLQMKKVFRINLSTIFIYLFFIIVCFITLYPFWYTLVGSMITYSEYTSKVLLLFPDNITFEAYKKILSTETIPNAYKVTIFITVVGTLLGLLMTSIGAYAISIRELPGRKFIIYFILITMLFNGGLIPMYLTLNSYHLIDSIWVYILPSLINTFYLIILKTSFEGIPKEIFESARIDGCKDIVIFFRIVLPLSKPALAAIALFIAVDKWNELFTALFFIKDANKYTLQAVLYGMITSLNVNSQNVAGASNKGMIIEQIKLASIIVATVPILLVYPFLQKHFAKGVMLGSIKG